MSNILFFLTPKKDTSFVYDHSTLRQVLEKLKHHDIPAISVIDKDGFYKGVIHRDDLINKIKEKEIKDKKTLEDEIIKDIEDIYKREPLNYQTKIDDVLHDIKEKNFLPVVDGRGVYIGIVEKKTIIKLFEEKLYSKSFNFA